MEFEVEISTMVSKRVKVNAENAAKAREIAEHLDQTGMYANARCTVENRRYSTHVRCPVCKELTSFYYTPEEDDKPICLRCFNRLARERQAKAPASLSWFA